MKLIKKYRNTSLLATSYSKGLYALYVAKYVRVYNSSNEKIYELRIDYPSAGCFSEDDSCLFVFFNNHYVLKIDFINDSVEKVLELIEDGIFMEVMSVVSNKLYILYSYFNVDNYDSKLTTLSIEDGLREDIDFEEKVNKIGAVRTTNTFYLVTAIAPLIGSKTKTNIMYLKNDKWITSNSCSNMLNLSFYCETLGYIIVSGMNHILIKKDDEILYIDETEERTEPIVFAINEREKIIMYEIDGYIKIVSLDSFKVLDEYEAIGKINIISSDTLETIKVTKGKLMVLEMGFIGNSDKVVFRLNNDIAVCSYEIN
ncbi:hypothetical protein M2475_001802 [Breznakia sp. PF5-3]|uniref:hypothetical protein n=1 Tax=unclassified Breznakia TaxID=2623764 RepID=UPI0024066CCA|nr:MULTISPECIES: hypothetical protein [unclassified Breznakia]MDF9825347.1 hypothetical protein [Breznakia sp. PM6-1]MDF9836225.1 hypothetical protein [Breznakia sp. PF5-3]MDF9838535.1 hypothetical protein [Breznakia sp. PFB2-8]MDF9860470.1 hypothetical protein [Breznakia sp. PH5-24]